MKLYKKGSKGQILFAEFTQNENTYTVTTGEIGTKNPVPHSKTCVGKNKGKSNETSAIQQATKELQAKYDKKLKKGYFETLKEAEEIEVILPMLAKEFSKEEKKVDYTNAYVQPKLDGMRCLDTINGKISRKNTPIETMEHIKVKRPGLLKMPIDGELYAHGLSFQENMKLIKKLRPESKNVNFYVYDLISKLPFIDRYAILKSIIELSKNLKLVPTYKVNNVEEIKKYHKQFLQEGYEGTMIRWGNEEYKINGRSSNLLKYKDFQDIAVKIIDIVPTEGRPEHGTPVLASENGTFKAGVKGSHEYRAELLTNKNDYIGKTAEIRFFEYTDDKIPRFPIMYGIRLDK